jgi:hypothetical protein
VGGFLAVVDGIRALRRRILSGSIGKAEAAAEAALIYDRTRFVQDLTNQTVGLALFFAVKGLVEGGGGDDDKTGLPVLTGTSPYQTTSRGERDNAYAVMPPMTIRIGTVQIGYGRLEPFATALASTVDLVREINRHGGTDAAVVANWLMRFKDQAKDKTFLQGVSNVVNAVEDPSRWAERLGANILTGFIPNLIRQPLRQTDAVVRDFSPAAGDGFFTSMAKRVGYSVAPGAAPPKMDVWGKPVPANRGDSLTGSDAADWLWHALDPLNVTVGARPDPIDLYIFTFNLATASPKERIAISPIDDVLVLTVPGEKEKRKIPLTREEHATANRNAGQAARAMLGEDWNWRNITPEGAERIRAAFARAQDGERRRLRGEKMAEVTADAR